MLVECPPEYDHVVEVHETVRPLEASQNEVHEPLESRRGVTKSERHDFKLEKALGCAEGGLLSISLLDLDLPVAAEEVQRAEPFGACKRVEGGIDTG